MLIVLFIILLTLLATAYVIAFLSKEKASLFKQIGRNLLLLFYGFTWILFVIALSFHSADFRQQIDPVDNDYTPLSESHILTFLCFFLLGFLGQYKIFRKGKQQPPLLFVFYLASMIIGIILNGLLILQLSSRSDNGHYVSSSDGYLMMIAPLFYISLSFVLIFQFLKKESEQAQERAFKNPFLNKLNQQIQKTQALPIWILFFLFPIFIIVTVILLLFGQEYDSLAKVFTETTTWHFSKETHPPYLDHEGHYLCTVAACGSPKIVKPVRLGIRHGNEIIVNRQLLIANAFEDLITQKHPRLHRFIRKNYDRYGYPLSKDINTEFKSNMTFILMKPLEWFFLFYIYVNANKPEQLINEQYAYPSPSNS